MKSRSRYLPVILIILTLLLSACGPDIVADVENLLDPEGEMIKDEVRKQISAEGSADVYYHYHMKTPDLKFGIDIPFQISFAESEANLGVWDANGIWEENMVTFTMAASGGPTGRCEITCMVNLKFVAQGKINLGSGGGCEIPMNFSFVPQGDYLMETTCPPETHDVVDCNALSMVMLDPSTYTFKSTNKEPKIPSENGVRLEAEIRNLVFPEGMKGTCKW